MLLLGLIDLGGWQMSNIWTDDNVSMYDELNVGKTYYNNDYYAPPLDLSIGGAQKPITLVFKYNIHDFCMSEFMGKH